MTGFVHTAYDMIKDLRRNLRDRYKDCYVVLTMSNQKKKSLPRNVRTGLVIGLVARCYLAVRDRP